MTKISPKNTKLAPLFSPKNTPKKCKNGPIVFPPRKYKNPPKNTFCQLWHFFGIFGIIFVFLGGFLYYLGKFCFIWGINVLFEILFVFFGGIFVFFGGKNGGAIFVFFGFFFVFFGGIFVFSGLVFNMIH
jgi:hypothetical protein